MGFPEVKHCRAQHGVLASIIRQTLRVWGPWDELPLSYWIDDRADRSNHPPQIQVTSELKLVLTRAKVLSEECCRPVSPLIAALWHADRSETFTDILKEIQWCVSVVSHGRDTTSTLELKRFPLETRMGYMEEEMLKHAEQEDWRDLMVELEDWDRDHKCSAKQCGNMHEPRDPRFCLATQMITRWSRQDSSSNDSINHLSSLWSFDEDPVVVNRSWHLGSGAFAIVEQSMWLGMQYAQKVFYSNMSASAEAKALAKLNHPHIVKVYACSESSFLMEMMSSDLNSFIGFRMRGAKSNMRGARDQPFSLPAALDLMLQIADAVNYVHSQGLAHRNLKPLNILVDPVKMSGLDPDDGYVYAKIAGFSMAEVLHEIIPYENLTQNRGTRKYMAPEIFGANKDDKHLEYAYPMKADVYSFGIICSEILSGEEPYNNIPLHLLYMKLTGPVPLRPQLPSDCPTTLVSLIHSCWDGDPRERPSFADMCQVLRYLKGIQSLHELGDHCWKPLEETWSFRRLLALVKVEEKVERTSTSPLHLFRLPEDIKDEDFFKEELRPNWIRDSLSLIKNDSGDIINDGSDIFEDETCENILESENLKRTNVPNESIEDGYQTFKDQVYEDMKRIDCIQEIAGDHVDEEASLHGQDIFILSFCDEKEEIFHFYFRNREDMASIVGVGLEHAMVILESGEVTIKEIMQEDWNQRWRSAETNVCKRKKLFKMKTTRPSNGYEGLIHLDVEILSKKPLLWELTKYFSLRESIGTFVTRDMFVEYARGVEASSLTSFNNQGEQSILNGTWMWMTRRFSNGVLQEDKNEGSTSNQIEERVMSDNMETATIVKLQLLEEGLDLKDEKVVEPFLGTIKSNFQFQFINDAGDRKDEKEIHIMVGNVSFTRGRDKDGEQSPWYHDNFQVIFGLLNEEVQVHGEKKDGSFKPLNMKDGMDSMKTSSAHEDSKGKESTKIGGVGIKPHGVGLSGGYHRKSSSQKREMLGLERGAEISNNNYTEGGLALLSSDDQFKIVCDYIVPEVLSRKPSPSRHFYDQQVMFQATWLPMDDEGSSSQFVEYTLRAKRDLLLKGKKIQQKYTKTILVNHFMTHLDGKTYRLRERKRVNSEGESGSILTEIRSWSRPQWSVEPLVEIKDPPSEVNIATIEPVDQPQANNQSSRNSSWTNRLINRGLRIVRRDRSTASGSSSAQTSVPESRQEVNGSTSNPTRASSMRW